MTASDKNIPPNYLQLAQSLAEFFHPLLEVGVFSGASRDTLSEVAVYNRLRSDEAPSLEGGGIRLVDLPDGRVVKQMEMAIEDHKGQTSGWLRLRFDLSLFNQVQRQIALLVGESKPTQASGQDEIRALIEGFFRDRQLTLEGMGRTQKRELIKRLFEQGAFDRKEGATHIAAALNMSRATVYNYLKWAQTVSSLQIHQVDAFTDKRFSGNPAGVVLDAARLSEEMMRKITREMNLSETSFVLPSAKADVRLRYFTPTGDEVKFCGHSTVGALYMLAHEGWKGMDRPGRHRLTIETLAGVLDAELRIEGDETITVGVTTPQVVLKDSPITLRQISEGLGIDASLIDASQPVAFEETNSDLFVVINSLKDLERVAVDQARAEVFCKAHGIVVVCLLTSDAFDRKNKVHCRCYAPAVGIAEDPFTGSIIGGLAHYLRQTHLVEDEEFGVEQGHFIGRPGSVRVATDGSTVKMTARAVHLFSTQMELT